ncbi:hypothetical protein D0864_16556, partial [Hortaea werneckii]
MVQHLRRAARIILIGAPGVGKGTQTERMLQRFPQLSAISSGDLLRENVRQRTPLGIQAEHLMSTGALVPDSMILRLIRNALTTRDAEYEYSDDANASFILDGFPRTASQAKQLAALLPMNMVIHIHTPASIVIDRICNRWIHAPSG